MNPNGESFQERFTSALSMPESAQRFLFLYWLSATEWLKRRAEESTNPQFPPRTNEGLPEWVCSAEEHIAKSEKLMEQLRRVEGYLGHPPRKIDPNTLEDAKCLAAAKWIRAAIQEGWSDKRIASWLSSYLRPSTKIKRGRPAGTVDFDGHALLALVLYDWNPQIWSYPKLADSLLECKCRRPHTADSDCVDKLKKAVKRLRGFLNELGYKHVGK